MNKSPYFRNLFSQVIENSSSSNWDNAVQEWDIVDWDEDDSIESSCICGKEHIRYLFTIENNETGKVLEPIGSQCIKKFEREDLNEITSIYEDLFKLKNALNDHQFISLSSQYFSRKLLRFFYEEEVFDSNFNKFNGKKDYDFMLKMFNKRKKSDITPGQQKKINAIIINQIIPYLELQLSKDRNVYS